GYAHGGGLGDPAWMHRVLDETHHRVEQLAGWGYRFPGPGPGSSRPPRFRSVLTGSVASQR
ncbi:hypothetical protein, partial [Nocardia brasiliensis]|uniref:hypothetical protein n=1 Tax=Nocardia brasiliensis TaxID=37326 RepID=UPI002454929D